MALPGACASSPDYSQSDLYLGFTLIDPGTETITEDAYIVVTGTKLTAIGSGDPPPGRFRSRRDLRGRFGMPGFVDAHAHITAGPHRIEVVDGAPAITIESVDEITQFSARMALTFGVTTVRNPAGDPEANARYDQQVASGAWIGPDAVHAGAVVQPPPFSGSAFTYPHAEAEWQAEAKRQADLGMKYFKLYVSLTESELATGIRVAHEHGLRAIAHLDRISWTRAARLGIDDLTHALPTSADLLAPALRSHYLATLGADSTFMYRWFDAATATWRSRRRHGEASRLRVDQVRGSPVCGPRAAPNGETDERTASAQPGHHALHCGARVRLVKGLRFAPTTLHRPSALENAR